MVKKTLEHGGIQAVCAAAMVKHKITAKSGPDAIAKASVTAAKDLGDKDPLRARRTIQWMRRHQYSPSEIAKRLKAGAKKAPAKKAAKKATEAPAQAAA